MRVTVTRPVRQGEALRWCKIDHLGGFAGDFFGSIEQLETSLLQANLLDRSLWGVAEVTVVDRQQVFLCDAQVLVECTVVTLKTPWGDERFVPADCSRC